MLVGLTSASFCTSVTGLICTFGFVTGLGASLAFNVTGVVPGSYFVKRLYVAYGVIQVGGGCGMFLVGPLTIFLLDQYNLSGTLLILGGIMFHVTLAGALLRPNYVSVDQALDIEARCPASVSSAKEEVGSYPRSTMSTLVASSENPPESLAVENQNQSNDKEATFSESSKEVATLNKLPEPGENMLEDENVHDDNLPEAKAGVMGRVSSHEQSASVCSGDLSHEVKWTQEQCSSGIENKCFISMTNVMCDEDPEEHRQNVQKVDKIASCPGTAVAIRSSGSITSLESTESKSRFKPCNIFKDILRTIVQVIHGNGFYIYLLSSILWTLGESSCMLHLPNYAESKGTTSIQTSTFLLGQGIATILCSLLSGFAVSEPAIGNTLLNFGCLGMSGLLTILFPLYSHSYSLQLVYTTLYGFYSQTPYTMVGPHCVQLVGAARLGVGYGLASFVTGLGFLFGPPIAGVLYEVSGVYDYSFTFAGCCLLAAAFLLALVPMFEKRP